MSMSSTTTLGSHPHRDALAKLVRDCLLEAQNAGYEQLESIAMRRAADSGLSREQAETSDGNVFDAIARPQADSSNLLGHLLARSVAGTPAEDAKRDASLLVHAAARTRIDALASLDAAAGDEAGALWDSIADLVEEHVRGGDVPRAEALVAAAGLGGSAHPVATRRSAQLASTLRDATLVRLLRSTTAVSQASPTAALKGEIVAPPRSIAATVLLGAVGWLLVLNVARLVGRFALQLRRPAEILVTEQGLKVRSSTTLLGKVLREQETLIPFVNLSRATREVRFSRSGLYGGLVALALGSYFGVSWFIDGVRVGSFSLAAIGLLVLATGIALDFVLMIALPGRQGRCRLVFTSTRGGNTCVGGVDCAAADSLLQGLARR